MKLDKTDTDAAEIQKEKLNNEPITKVAKVLLKPLFVDRTDEMQVIYSYYFFDKIILKIFFICFLY